jgi:signal transduction histidine kinase
VLQASLEIKRLFVRYVSHEIRTPLNTTLLGLNLLENDLKDGVDDRAVLGELVSDATSSCTIAIGILNDLLMYEKIDGGLLTLERAETPVWAFVEGVLKVFLIQVRSTVKCIDRRLLTCSCCVFVFRAGEEQQC